MAFVLLLMGFLIDAALHDMVDDSMDPVSADLAMVRRSNNIPLLTQSHLYHLGAKFQYLSLCQHCHSSQHHRVLLVLRRRVCKLT